MNRYTSLTPSQFNPLSLEEIMLVPSMKRKKHDDTVKGLEEIRSKLANVDPEDKYFDEAVKLREQLNNKLTSQVESINKEGFNPNSTGQFLAMNREYQDLMSPTGKLGMINQEKKNTQAYIENYRKEGLAMGLTPEQMQRHIDAATQKRNNEMPLYDEKDRTIGLKIDKNVVKAQDIFKDFAEHAARSGMSSTARGNISAGIQVAPNGEFTYVNTTGWDSEKGDNAKQIQSALDFMNSRLNDDNSDYSKYYDYIGQDKESIAKALQQQAGIYLKETDGYKSSNQISNLIDERSKAGSGSEFEHEKPIYSNASETTSIGNDYDKVTEDANKIINDPEATSQDKLLARQKLDLIDDVRQELLNNDKEFKTIVNQIENKLTNSGLSKELQKKISNAPFINTSFARIAGRNKAIYLGHKLVVVTPEELNKIKQIENLFNSNQKRKRQKINESLSTRGLEETTFTQDMKIQERKEYFANVQDALNTDTAKPTSANYITSDGHSEKLDMNDKSSTSLVNLMSNGELLAANPARQGNSIGLKVRVKPAEGSEVWQKGMFANKNFDGTQAVEMFIPITELNDNMTGLRHTTNRVYNNLPSGVKREIDKMVQSSNLGASTNVNRLGDLGVPASQYFNEKYSEDTKIDFLQKGKLNDKVFIPHTISKEGVKKPITWNNVVDFNKLNDLDYLTEISNTGLHNNIEYSYMKEKNIESKDLPKDSTGNIDYLFMMNYLKYKDLKLPATQDLIEFSQLNSN